MRRTTVFTVLTAAFMVFQLAAMADAAPLPYAPSAEQSHCSAVASGVRKTGELIINNYQCFATQEAADAHLAAESRAVTQATGRLLAGNTTYWDGYTPGIGNQFTLQWNCGSGYLNFQNFAFPGGGTWRNKTSSLGTTCSYVSFYYAPDLVGAHVNRTHLQTLVGTGLDNNSASSGIQYG